MYFAEQKDKTFIFTFHCFYVYEWIWLPWLVCHEGVYLYFLCGTCNTNVIQPAWPKRQRHRTNRNNKAPFRIYAIFISLSNCYKGTTNIRITSVTVTHRTVSAFDECILIMYMCVPYFVLVLLRICAEFALLAWCLCDLLASATDLKSVSSYLISISIKMLILQVSNWFSCFSEHL